MRLFCKHDGNVQLTLLVDEVSTGNMYRKFNSRNILTLVVIIRCPLIYPLLSVASVLTVIRNISISAARSI
jgi:hypothetical protein